MYKGVAEVSIYIGEKFRGIGVGKVLLTELTRLSEENGFWSLESVIIKENVASIELNKKCGFREIGFKEKPAKTSDGVWHDVILMERRSNKAGLD